MVAQKCKVSKIWTISCDNSETLTETYSVRCHFSSKICTIICDNFETVWDRMSVSSNHWQEVAYRPLFYAISPNLIALQANYITVVKDRPIISEKYCHSFLAKADPPCRLQHGLSATAELLVKLTTSSWLKLNPYFLGQKCRTRNLVYDNIRLMVIFAEITQNKCINERHPIVKGDNLINTVW